MNYLVINDNNVATNMIVNSPDLGHAWLLMDRWETPGRPAPVRLKAPPLAMFQNCLMDVDWRQTHWTSRLKLWFDGTKAAPCE